MKNKLLVFILSLSIILLTLGSITPKIDTDNNSFSSYLATSSSLTKYKLQIHVPAPSSDDYQVGT